MRIRGSPTLLGWLCRKKGLNVTATQESWLQCTAAYCKSWAFFFSREELFCYPLELKKVPSSARCSYQAIAVVPRSCFMYHLATSGGGGQWLLPACWLNNPALHQQETPRPGWATGGAIQRTPALGVSKACSHLWAVGFHPPLLQKRFLIAHQWRNSETGRSPQRATKASA